MDTTHMLELLRKIDFFQDHMAKSKLILHNYQQSH